jgi:hypothetical protein
VPVPAAQQFDSGIFNMELRNSGKKSVRSIMKTSFENLENKEKLAQS